MMHSSKIIFSCIAITLVIGCAQPSSGFLLDGLRQFILERRADNIVNRYPDLLAELYQKNPQFLNGGQNYPTNNQLNPFNNQQNRFNQYTQPNGQFTTPNGQSQQ